MAISQSILMQIEKFLVWTRTPIFGGAKEILFSKLVSKMTPNALSNNYVEVHCPLSFRGS